MLSCEYCKIFKISWFEEHLRTAAFIRCYFYTINLKQSRFCTTYSFKKILVLERKYKNNLKNHESQMLSDIGEWGVTSVRKLDCAMTRHAELKNILLTRNLPIDSDVSQWSHPFMMPLQCLWTKSNNRTRGQFECHVAWFCFCFDFVRSYTRCGCCCIFCWRGLGCSFKIGRPRSTGCKNFWRW